MEIGGKVVGETQAHNTHFNIKVWKEFGLRRDTVFGIKSVSKKA